MEDPDPPVSPGRMWALGLYKSVVLVLFLLRQNPVQEAAAELFGISQATVSLFQPDVVGGGVVRAGWTERRSSW
ncbi:membrane protein [Streptomyces noursei ATCC 11455]|uniref:hypothetical protein n=1 Tax=Streptomyces noursei TaxID=1971 RepID=UPI00081CCBE4|nr:membrane protein [Streptomyces noursei ATCC 11455]